MKIKTLSCIMALAVVASGVALASGPRNEVGRFTIGTRGLNILASNQVVAFAVPDPKVRGITCHVQTVEAKGLTLSADPTYASIACRQTGKLFAEDVAKVSQKPDGEDIFSQSTWGLGGRGSGGLLNTLFQALNVKRIWDGDNQTYIYVTYTTQLFNGVPRTNISTVPTYGQF